jgi:hypothetical protein
MWNRLRLFFLKRPIKTGQSRAPVSRTYNPSYSGGRDQEDHSSKPAQANSLRDPISKNPSQKRADGMAQGVCTKKKAGDSCHP